MNTISVVLLCLLVFPVKDVLAELLESSPPASASGPWSSHSEAQSPPQHLTPILSTEVLEMTVMTTTTTMMDLSAGPSSLPVSAMHVSTPVADLDLRSSVIVMTSTNDPSADLVMCDDALCETGIGVWELNTSHPLCGSHNEVLMNFSSSYESQTVTVWSDPETTYYRLSCRWTLLVPASHWVIMTFDQLPSVAGGNPGQVEFQFWDQSYNPQTSVSTWYLSHGIVNMTWKYTVLVDFTNYQPDTGPNNVTFRLALIRNALSAVSLTNSTGYVTSPGFDQRTPYPADFEATYDIHMPESHSLILKFEFFDLQSEAEWGDCASDYVTIHDLSDTGAADWKECGAKPIPLKIYRSPVRLRFTSDSDETEATGFRLDYVIVPTHQEPVLVSEPHRYDCTVSHFPEFSQLFRCNFQKECESNEDEQDCDYEVVRFPFCRDTVMCQTGPHFYVMYPDSSNSFNRIVADTVPNTFAILLDTNIIMGLTISFQLISFQLNVLVPVRHRLMVSFNPISAQVDAGNAKILLTSFDQPMVVFDSEALQAGNATFNSLSDSTLEYVNEGPFTSAIITFDVYAVPNILPHGNLSEHAGFVTSPNFAIESTYPDYYDGMFDIHIPDSFSVLIKVAYLAIRGDPPCGDTYLENDFLMIYEIQQEHTSDQVARVCGKHLKKRVFVFSSSVRVRFKSNYEGGSHGFKLLYAIVPRHSLPELSEDGLYNCSVPHYALWEPLLRCDWLAECQAGEDEADCLYSGDCGPGHVDAGSRCYSLERPEGQEGGGTAWYSASNLCRGRGQRLVTLEDEQTRLALRNISFAYDVRDVFVGLQLTTPLLPPPLSFLYRGVWQWVDGRSAFTVPVRTPDGSAQALKTNFPLCSLFVEGDVYSADCFQPMQVDVLCQADKPPSASGNLQPALAHQESSSSFSSTSSSAANSSVTFPGLTMVPCPLGHVTRDFLMCDAESRCGGDSHQDCPQVVVNVPQFRCQDGQNVPFTLVCDHAPHCSDGSDEDFCLFPSCPYDQFQCSNKQCVSIGSICDGKQYCMDHSDELCQMVPSSELRTATPPAVVDMYGDGLYNVSGSPLCPEDTHFRCSDGLCLPGFLRCNGVSDCVAGEDEAGCDDADGDGDGDGDVCEGCYRCRGSAIRLHPVYVCDGIFHCPEYDDELLCKEPLCPATCSCQGLEFVCTDVFPLDSFPDLRYLDVSGSGVNTHFLLSAGWGMIAVRLSRNGITDIARLSLPNLRTLDLSDNQIASVNVRVFDDLKNLRTLVLRGNPVHSVLSVRVPVVGGGGGVGHGVVGPFQSDVFVPLIDFDLSQSQLVTFNGNALTSLPQLQRLNLSHSPLTTITDEGFASSPQLTTVDISHSLLKTFPSDLLRRLGRLRTVHSSNFVLCCQAMLPEGFDPEQCHAEEDLLTSCEDLMRFDSYRVFLWVFASLALLGNAGSLVGRLYLGRKEKQLGSFSVFVSSLSVSDFLMGVYLTIIGAADLTYRGRYLWHSEEWTHSAGCQAAGFLSLVSSEVSAFLICLITLDRFLVLRFPFSTRHFTRTSAVWACLGAWSLGVVLAALPLLPFAAHWDYYSQTGVCIPLPFSSRSSSQSFPGRHYAFALMIVVNMVLFLLIAAGQAAIFWSVRHNSMSAATSSSSSTGRDTMQATIARRLTTIVVSDFLCWFPIGLLGLLAAAGTPIPGEINVGVAVFVLPFNSALNPFLYTLNTLLEKRQEAAEERLMKKLESRFTTLSGP